MLEIFPVVAVLSLWYSSMMAFTATPRSPKVAFWCCAKKGSCSADSTTSLHHTARFVHGSGQEREREANERERDSER